MSIEKKIEQKRNIEKPSILYHSSNNQNITEFDPSLNTKNRGLGEKKSIFATPDYKMATIFLVPTDDSWANSGNCDGTWYFVCGDKDRFLKLDKGGVIYTLPSKSFTTDKTIGLGSDEYRSTDKVVPIGSKKINSALDEMIKNGVQVYFITSEQYKEFETNHDAEILNKTVSENEKRGQKVSKLTDIEWGWGSI